jgi:uncharacterized protein (DUF2062 family)
METTLNTDLTPLFLNGYTMGLIALGAIFAVTLISLTLTSIGAAQGRRATQARFEKMSNRAYRKMKRDQL